MRTRVSCCLRSYSGLSLPRCLPFWSRWAQAGSCGAAGMLARGVPERQSSSITNQLDKPILFLATANAKRARSFYEGVLGLTFVADRSEEHTSELQSRLHLVCRLLL